MRSGAGRLEPTTMRLAAARQRMESMTSTSFPRFESYPYDQSIGLVLRSAFLRASRRTATCKIVPASILRDAVLRRSPQDEVRGIEFHSVRYDRFHEIDALVPAKATASLPRRSA